MEDRKVQIIECAIEQFNKNGIQAATISQIAQAVGISKGTLYYYFPSKLELVDTCFEYVKENAARMTLSKIDYSAEPEKVIKDLVKYSLIWPLEKQGEMEFLDKYIAQNFNDENSFNLFSFNLFEENVNGKKMKEVTKDCPPKLMNFLIGDILTSVSKFVTVYPKYEGNPKFIETISQMVWDLVSKK